jgi:hypothetical protein
MGALALVRKYYFGCGLQRLIANASRLRNKKLYEKRQVHL